MPTKLGQNFLKDQSVVSKIIEAADLSRQDTVIEIGPGQGILTTELATRAKNVIAIEIDRQLIPSLEKLFDKSNVDIIEGDVLKLNLPDLIVSHNLQRDGYRVVANIPYYITSAIIRLFLETKYPPKEMVLMIQKEVAERIVATPGTMSVLAVSVQRYATPEILFFVDKNSFSPAPEVDSAVIKISTIKNGGAGDHKNFFRIVRAGFCAKRKTLANNLANSLHVSKNEVEEVLIALSINPKQRPQELSLEQWDALSQSLAKIK